MTLGLAIFLSSIFLGTVALFIATKDRWRWKRIVFWTILGTVALSCLSGVLYLYFAITSGPAVQRNPTLLTEFWGISLDSTQEDIRFMKGQPSEIIDDNLWSYTRFDFDKSPLYTAYIAFKDGKVRYVICSAYVERNFRDDCLANYTYEEIINGSGEPVEVSELSNRYLIRMYSYPKYNAVYIFQTANEVKGYGMYNPAFGPIELISEEQINDYISYEDDEGRFHLNLDLLPILRGLR